MIAEANVYAVLAATAGVTDLVGDRIFPIEAPGGTALPYLVFQRISTEPAITHDQNDATKATHLDGCHFQVTAIGATLLSAVGVIYQVRRALEYSSGLQAVWTDERSLPRNDEAQAFGHSADFLVWKENE